MAATASHRLEGSSLAGASAAWSPALSPDGDQVAYVSDQSGAPGVRILDRRSGLERALEAAPRGVRHVHWSIDGDWLSLAVAPRGTPRTEAWVIRPDGRDAHRLPGTPGGASFLGPWTHERNVLAVAHTTPVGGEGMARLENASTGERQLIATGGQPLVLDLDRHNRTALIRRGPRGARSVWVVDLVSGRERELLPNAGAGSTDLGRLSPDLRVAYLRSDAGRELHALFEVVIEPGTPASILAQRADADLEQIALTADGRTALLVWNAAGRSECELLDLGHGTRSALPLPEPVADDCSFSRDGRWLAMTLEGPTHPRAVWLYEREHAAWTRISRAVTFRRPPRARPTLERLRAEDGLDLTGWLYRAAEPAPGAPLSDAAAPGPAVIHLHGGPEAQERPTYNPLFQELSAQGIHVFAPNVRGSSGFGHSFVNADNLERRFGAIADVASCARYLIDRGIAASGNIACAGRSYGGYLTLAALVFHPGLFVAGVDICGIADFHSFYARTEPWIGAAAYSKYGHPVRDAALLQALSPIHRFDRLRAPLLVVHGETDSNVPLYEAEQVVAAARARGVPVEYLYFREEGHELVQVLNKEVFVRETVAWLTRWLRPSASSGPAQLELGTPGTAWSAGESSP